MGIMCGLGGIGVAPFARWMTCKGCFTDSCTDAALLSCSQWILCPTLADGSSPDCSRAPRLVSNSWGGNQGDTWYDSAIAAWQTADIIPIFSIGNDGPGCGTAGSPGNQYSG